MHLEIEEINKTSLRKEHIKYFEIFGKLKRKRILFNTRNILSVVYRIMYRYKYRIHLSKEFLILHPHLRSKRKDKIYIYVRKNIRKKYSYEGGGRTSRGNGKFIRRFNRRSRG